MSSTISTRAALIIVAVVVAFAALRQAQVVFAPALLALTLGVVLAPLMSRVERAGVPTTLAAIGALLLTIAALVVFILVIEPHVTRAMERAPILISEIRDSLRGVLRTLRGVQENIESVTGGIDGGDDSEESAGIPKLSTALLSVPSVGAQVLVFIGTLFFFLLTRDETYALLARLHPNLTLERLFAAEAMVSRYFATITAINAAFGLCVAGAMALIGMPSPSLWGALAFVVNFVLYLGPVMLAFTLLIAGTVVFDGLTSLLPAACYLGLNMTEGQFLTPALVGRRMTINPLVLFLTLIFMLWLWGPIGGIVALPALIWGSAVAGILNVEDQPVPEAEPEASGAG